MVRVSPKYWLDTLGLVDMTVCKTSAIPAEVKSCTEEDPSPSLEKEAPWALPQLCGSWTSDQTSPLPLESWPDA